jgi:cell division septation protein DedD
MEEMHDTEVTLGTGKLLAMFFGAAIICGIFFSFGHAVGKNSTPAAGVAIMDSSTLANVSVAGGAKPAATHEAAAPVEPAATAAQASAADSAPQTTQPAPELASNTDAQKLSATPTSTVGGSGYVVQVAAVSKSEDADALKDALARKQYPVFVVNNDANHLFHVQVGPFSDQKDAEAMKNKLAQDGYNAILKK